MAKLILVGGGARSGKSRFALAQALGLGPRRVFLATAEALDGEMTERIDRHRSERGTAFETIEEPLALAETLDGVGAVDVVLVDCLTLWVSNLLVRGDQPRQMRAAFDSLESSLARRRAHIILVTNEVGMGLVPETALGRIFRDQIGDLHQRIAARADEIYAAVMGVVVRLHPGPIEITR
ncbi:MAG: bifunctional adenosylcobinamide kinase/adenosylcobinamide-phosphate guanylyltransferase [Deltaproteobacteria bacterium]|nr:bifunctional adenosylcobinamide kinase/adenosylcobinamide-phosphate guanylyltransferase [Deltaproteobacteria bacterium]